MLGLFLEKWRVSRGVELFKELTMRFFGNKSKTVLSKLHQYVRGVVSDGFYDTAEMEASLKAQFGEIKRVFDFPSNGVSRCKVAVTATTITNALSYIFSNYNGIGLRDSFTGLSSVIKVASLDYSLTDTVGYKHSRPEEKENEPHIWEAGRATSAAPL